MDCTLPCSPHKNDSEKVRTNEDNEKEISGPAALFGDGPEPDSDDSLGSVWKRTSKVNSEQL